MQRLNRTWDDTDIPQTVKHACCEEALALLSIDKGRIARLESGIQSTSIGDVSESYSEVAISKALAGEELFSPIAKQLLSRYRIRTRWIV